MIALLVYLVYPPAVAWSSFPAPDWLRWLGVVLGFLTFPLFAWIHWALGKNFNTTLYVRPDHTLVTHGPYRWVRHPMYTAILLYMVSVGLISANWFLLISGVFLIGVVIVIRTPKEEALMVETFGEAYRAYQRRTGALWPRLLAVRS
jgi:protein-S-isoprenylcysteine O-methyltransferase Ste14